jgi:hypothetical protein
VIHSRDLFLRLVRASILVSLPLAACTRVPSPAVTPAAARTTVPVFYAPRLVPQPASLAMAGDSPFVVTGQTCPAARRRT